MAPSSTAHPSSSSSPPPASSSSPVSLQLRTQSLPVAASPDSAPDPERTPTTSAATSSHTFPSAPPRQIPQAPLAAENSLSSGMLVSSASPGSVSSPPPAPASASASASASSASASAELNATPAWPRRQQRVHIVTEPMSAAAAATSGMHNRASSSSVPRPVSSSSSAAASGSTPRASIVAPDSSGAHSPSTTSVRSNTRPASSDHSNSSASQDQQRRPEDSSPAPASSSPSRPRFFSRLSLPLPLRSRKSHVADFYLRTHEPHKKYRAGEHVRGVAVVIVVKPVRITHLTVALHGFVRVARDPAVVAKAQGSAVFPLHNGSSESPRYHGNGLASLFQDEQILSGEGRLDAGKYEFGFDLLFPSKDLPSSIDFERGCISYYVTATLTRPTSVAPTSSCETRVTLVDRIDVGLLRPPSPRSIFLEPVPKRRSRKKSMVMDKTPPPPVPSTTDVNDLASEASSVGPSVGTEDSHDRITETRSNDHRADQSDIRSEFSGESGRSVSTGGLSRAELAQVATAKQQVVDNKTITTTIELLRGGCLPGDTVTVKVTVQHIKRIKSMSGIIVTLFRQGKIDSAPPASLFADVMTKDDKRRREKGEVYPRSKTGLGGLSLISTGSTSIFRKDLDQVITALIVHPTTLQTSVTVTLKVPDDAFPTIKGVPGDMISFKYQAEVLVDLGGRLSNQFQGSQGSRFGQFAGGVFEQSSKQFHSPRSHITDTAPLRREKGVVAVTMETVVGTMDSARGRQRNRPSRTLRTTQSDEDETAFTDYSHTEEGHYGTPYVNGHSSSSYFVPHSSSSSNRHYAPSPIHSQPPPPPPTEPPQPYPYETNGEPSSAAPAYVPPPQIPNQQNMTEKERMRYAETRLLPSQPPAGPSSASASAPASASASAPDAADPSAPDGDNLYDAADSTPRGEHASPNLGHGDNFGEGPSAPTQDDMAGPTDATPTEDKQEQERRRLLAEASAPPEVPEDVQRNMGSISRRDMAPDAEASAPSAPALNDDDYDYHQYGARAGPSHSSTRHHSEQLPAYER